jgi:hypothetical protein
MEINENRIRAMDTGTVVLCLLLVVCVVLFEATSGDALLWMWEPLFVFLRMASIVGILGILSYFIGESLPRSMYDPRRFPFKTYAWEQNGHLYEKLGVKWRKAHAIDMSVFMKRSFPKQNTVSRDPAHLRRLVQEMCNAELVHAVLTLFSPLFALLIEGWYGIVIAVFYALFNLSDVMIQRYNRPRIMMILERLER